MSLPATHHFDRFSPPHTSQDAAFRAMAQESCRGLDKSLSTDGELEWGAGGAGISVAHIISTNQVGAQWRKTASRPTRPKRSLAVMNRSQPHSRPMRDFCARLWWIHASGQKASAVRQVGRPTEEELVCTGSHRASHAASTGRLSEALQNKFRPFGPLPTSFSHPSLDVRCLLISTLVCLGPLLILLWM